MYYDCWEISEYDFELYKDNFVLTDKDIKFYFDDCIVCPSYTGTYFIEVSKEQLKEYISQPYLSKDNLKDFL